MIEKPHKEATGYALELQYKRADILRIGEELAGLKALMGKQQETLKKAKIERPDDTTYHGKLTEEILKSEKAYRASATEYRIAADSAAELRSQMRRDRSSGRSKIRR